MGKISSNPAEQTNLGLLPIREFAPYKILLEGYYYIQKKFTDREEKQWRATTCSLKLRWRGTLKTCRILDNIRFWMIDGAGQAKIQTSDQQREYLVHLNPPSCSYFEFQDMIWPCEHVMAWDNRDGRDYTSHFHPCWRVSSV